MNSDLSGKVAVVTGGTSGIGRRVVELLRDSGARVFFTGTNAGRGAEVAAATGAEFFACDAALPESAEALVGHVQSAGAGIDILVNNAGRLGSPVGLEATTLDVFEATIAVHLRAPWLLMARVAPLMRARGGGSVVNMASVAGHRVGASSTAYSVSKAALIHLTRCAAAEFGRDSIRVNSVSPGFVSTMIHAEGLPGSTERGERFVGGLGRLFVSLQAIPHQGAPRDVAETVLFLASEASAFITGADIVVDGGLMWGRHGLM
jgi:NAD(P)-dependent dehydrogenase (short-subunit alcohol dehydrogenase family)